MSILQSISFKSVQCTAGYIAKRRWIFSFDDFDDTIVTR